MDRCKTVLLLHGKNFFGASWKEAIEVLARNGHHVNVPDQVGFGKSSKPNIHYSFHLLAANTKKLLDTLGIGKVMVVGHSMGGMLSTRLTLMYPGFVTHLVLEDPIGLDAPLFRMPHWGNFTKTNWTPLRIAPASIKRAIM
jgi:pimeloyl-ACP methyl ester carboxylesterase